MGDLLTIDVDVRSDRRVARARIWQSCRFDRHDADWRSGRVSAVGGVSVRSDQPIASAESISAGWARSGRTRI